MSGALVYRCTGRGDLLLGTATDPRPERFSRTVGLFANLVPVRLRPDGGSTVDRLLDAACDAVFDAIDAGAVPLEALAAALRPAYDPSHPPLVQLVCTIWDRDYAHLSCADLDWDVLEVPRTRARFDLMMEHVFDAGAWTVHVEYDTGLFGPDTVARFVAHLARLIRGAASAPASRSPRWRCSLRRRCPPPWPRTRWSSTATATCCPSARAVSCTGWSRAPTAGRRRPPPDAPHAACPTGASRRSDRSGAGSGWANSTSSWTSWRTWCATCRRSGTRRSPRPTARTRDRSRTW